MNICFRDSEYKNPNLRLRIEEAKHHVQQYGCFEGETRRQAIVNLAALDLQEEDLADTQGLLPPDPV